MNNNTKSTKSPAPATKVTAKKAPTTAKAAVASDTKKKTPRKAGAKSVVSTTVLPVAAAPVRTTITATIDIGFGNALYLRGEGAGLSWDRGVLMNCVSDDTWSLELGESVRPIIYKLLVNDLTWSAGEDYVVTPGATASVVPTF